MPIYPLTDSKKDHDAADIIDQFYNRIKLDLLLKGYYPKQLCKKLGILRPHVQSGDMDLFSTHPDFLGVNYYTCASAHYKWYIPLLHAWITGSKIADTEYVKDGTQYTSMGWPVNPEGFCETLMRLKQEYNNPTVFVTENGAAFDDKLQGGAIHDTKRIDYFDSHIAMLHKAISQGANVKRYYAWSLLDNFEWSAGFSKRFGLIYVDYTTQKRTIKDSGYWYSNLIKNQNRA